MEVPPRTVISHLMRENRKLYRQRRLQTLAILILGVLLMITSGNAAKDREVAADAKRTLAGVESLNASVDQMKADSSVNAENQQKIYAAILETQEETLSILCTGVDPIRKVACEQVGVTGTATSPVTPASPPAEATPAEPAVTG